MLQRGLRSSTPLLRTKVARTGVARTGTTTTTTTGQLWLTGGDSGVSPASMTAKHQHERELERRKQERLANMGSLVDTIKMHVPGLLQAPFPREIISDSICLKVLPVSHPSFPAAHGRMAYTAVMKTLQLAVSNVLLPPNSSLGILSTQLKENEREFVLRWRTSLNQNYKSRSKKYPESWSSKADGQQPFAPGQLARTLRLLPHEYPVLTGIFEFQFNPECTHVSTMVINDVEYISRQADTLSGASACV